MVDNSLYLLWLPKYFDEYYKVTENSKIEEQEFLIILKKFLQNNNLIYNCRLKIHDKRVPDNIKRKEHEFISFHKEKNAIGYWGKIQFETIESSRRGEVIFSEFGFHYFEFTNNEGDCDYREEDEKIIQSFFSREYNYPLLTETQENVLKETFLNDHLDYKDFNRKEREKKIKIEDFILEAYYKVDEKDVDIHGKAIQSKILILTEYEYEVKRDEYYNFKSLQMVSDYLQPLQNDIEKCFLESGNIFHHHMYQKIILDVYEEQAISKFLTTVVSAKYFDRITKSIREVREGLTGKIIYMTPQDTSAIDNKYQKNSVFKKWSEEKIENYVQLLISKKPLFTKIDNALKSAYYITIGNVTSLGHINDKEDISQLMHYHEWKSLLSYFAETTKSLNTILNLYHSNRTYSELEEIKHYESNNHDKEDIELLIKSNENKLGSTEDSRTIMMMMAIMATAMVALPDMIGSIDQFPDLNVTTPFRDGVKEIFYFSSGFFAFVFYLLFLLLGALFFGTELSKLFETIKENKKDRKLKNKLHYSKSAPDDFDILEHRSNMPIRSFLHNDYKKISILYEEHISTHRFVRHIEAMSIRVCGGEDNSEYRILPEIVTIEGMQEKNKDLYNHIKEYRTTKFSVNRIDKAKIKVSMRYRVNRININAFLDYYGSLDSYIEFYKDYCTNKTKTSYSNKCKKINSPKVIERLKKDFEGIDAEFSFVAIYAFSLISKTLDHAHQKEFDLYKDSFRVYFHIDKFPHDYHRKEFELRSIEEGDEENSLKPYDALSEMIYLVFLGRLKGFNYEESIG